jgi:DHA2 family multidrug resistance protein
MLIAGRLLARGVAARPQIFAGLALTVLSLWQMAHFSADVPAGPVVMAGIIQGLGLGFVFVPISTVAYATLPMTSRTEAAGIFSLLRNVGSSIGISLVFTLLARGTQQNHAELAARLTPFEPDVAHWLAGADPGGNAGSALALLNAEVTRQASAIAFANDFWLMMWLTAAALPLLFLFRPQPAARAAAPRIRQGSTT